MTMTMTMTMMAQTGSGQLDFVFGHLTDLLWGVPNNRPGGLVMTLILSVIGIGVGMAVAVLVSAARQSRFAALRWLATNYVRVVRGVPLILVLLLVHRFVAVSLGAANAFGSQRASLLSAAVALILYSSAYQSDIITAGLRAVPTTLVEDARLLGSSRLRTYASVQIPFGLRLMKPALVSQAVTLFKDSSVVVVLGVADLTTTARLVLGADVGNAPYWVATYLTVGVLYFVVAFGLSQLVARFRSEHQRMGLVTVIE
jgi:general L-amino acid transport system permease protein